MHTKLTICLSLAALLLGAPAAQALQDPARLDKIISDLTALRCRQADSQDQQRKLLTLLQAIRNGSANIGAHLTNDNRTALHLACALGSRQTVEWLLKSYPPQDYVEPYGTPFMCTTDDNGAAIRKLLVWRQATRRGTSPLADADRKELEAIMEKLYALRCRERSYQINHEALLRSLEDIWRGESVNATRTQVCENRALMIRTPLQYACGLGSLGTVKWLLAHGANPNLPADEGKLTTRDCVAQDQRRQIMAALDEAEENWQETLVEIELTNGDKVALPQDILRTFGDVNARLKEILTPDDYTDIIKEEAAWAAGREGRDEKDVASEQAKLLETLGKIVENPGDANVFRRPRFIAWEREGVNFVHDVLSHGLKFAQGNSRMLLTMDGSAGSSVLHFWDARTGKLCSSYTAPDLAWNGSEDGTILNVEGTSVYVVGSEPLYPTFIREGNADFTWAGLGHVELIDPVKQRIQVLDMGIPGNNVLHTLSRYYDATGGDLVRETSFPVKAYLGEECEKWAQALARNIQVEDRERLLLDKGTADSWKKYYGDLNMGKGAAATGAEGRAFVAGQSDGDWGYKGMDGEVNMFSLQTLRAQQKTDIQGADVKRVKESIPASLFATDFMGWPALFDNIQAIRAEDGSLFFMLGTDVYSIIRHIGEIDVIYGILTPDGKAYVWTRADSLEPFDSLLKSAKKAVSGYAIGEEQEKYFRGYNGTGGASPLAITQIAPGRYRLVYREFEQNSNKCHIAELDMAGGKIRRLGERDVNVMAYWPKPGIAVTATDDDSHYVLQHADRDFNLTFMGDLFIDRQHGYAIVLSDGRYTGTPGCEQFLTWKKNGRSIGMKALAPWRNRPAEVLQALGGNTEDIEVLQQTTARWLAKLGVSPGEAEPAAETFPEIQVAMPDLFVAARQCRVGVRVHATERAVTRLRVKMDDAPLDCTVPGLPVPAGESAEVALELPLVEGQNWIEITPEDAAGRIGDSVRFRVVCTARDEAPPAMYMVALGVSDYDNEDLKLQYAAKDAGDMAATFSEESLLPVHTLLLRDKEVDRHVMERVKGFLESARPQDSVVLFIAGHGMLDEQLNYYYVPCNFDVDDLKGSGIPMDEITRCLQGTPARKRLLLLDTCHAGSIGEEGEEKMALAMDTLPHGVRAVQTRGMKVKKVLAPLAGSRQKRYIEEMFAMDDSVEGINILSGSAGAEFAQESGEWRNGVFTASVIEAVRGYANADSNADGVLTVQEMQQHVTAKVRELTNGLQSPSPKLTGNAGFFPLAKSLRGYIPESWNEKISAENAEILLSKLRRMEPVSHPQSVGQLLDIFERGGATKEMQREIARLIKDPCQVVSTPNTQGSLLETVYRYEASQMEHPLLEQLMRQSDLSVALGKPGAGNPISGVSQGNLPGMYCLMLHGMHPGLIYELATNGADEGEDSYRNPEEQAVLETLRRLKEADTSRLDQPYELDTHIAGPLMAKFMAKEFFQRISSKEYGGTLTDEYKARIPALFADRVDYCGMPRASASDILRSLNDDRYHYETDSDNSEVLERNGTFYVKMPYNRSIQMCPPNQREYYTGLVGVRLVDGKFKIVLVRTGPSGASLFGMLPSATSTGEQSSYTPDIPDSDETSAQDVINHLNAMDAGKGAAKVFRGKLLQIMPRIQNGADVSSPLPGETNTPLHYACGLNDVLTVQWLLDHGANAAARNKQGQTPADCARLNNSWDALDALERGGASQSSYQPSYSPGVSAQGSVSAQDVINHLNALGAGKGAAKVFRSKLLQIMPRIQNGADVSSPLPGETNTPLHYACGLNDVLTVQWLLDHGANAAARNKQGQTPADCARLNNSGAVLSVLQQRGVAY